MIEEYCKYKYLISLKVHVGLSFLISHFSFLTCHKSYKLTEKDCFNQLTNLYIKMNYYRFNRQEILQKAKEKYFKGKAAEYYTQNKKAIKEKSRERYKNLSQEKKTRLKSIKEKLSRIGSI